MPLVAPVTSAVDGLEMVEVMRTASSSFGLNKPILRTLFLACQGQNR
jgi:hypothetical protein